MGDDARLCTEDDCGAAVFGGDVQCVLELGLDEFELVGAFEDM